MAQSLWEEDSPSLWRGHLDAYAERLARLNKDRLADLDARMAVIAEAVTGRAEPHLTSAELVTAVDWKLTRGKFRPRLLGFAQEHADEDVRELSAECFAKARRGGAAALSEALTRLCSLRGIGPATASLLLSLGSPDVPFFSDEAFAAVFPGTKPKYTMPELTSFAKALQAKAKALNAAAGDAAWAAREVERALWSAAAEHMPPRAPNAAGGGKKGPGVASRGVIRKKRR